MTEQKVDPLWDAVSRNTAVVVSLTSAGQQLAHHKSRFLAPADGGFWVQSIDATPGEIDALIASGRPAGISFRIGNKRFVFPAPILRFDDRFPVNASVTAAALLLRTPASLHVIQRRTNFRVHVTPDSGVSVRVWRIGATAYLRDRVLPSQEIPSELRDLSLAGIGVNLFAKDGVPPRVSPADRLKVQLTFNDVCLTLVGRLRYPREIPGDATTVRAGIHFRITQSRIEGRQAIAVLTRVLGERQRVELRRLRLGLTLCGLALRFVPRCSGHTGGPTSVGRSSQCLHRILLLDDRVVHLLRR